LPLPLGSIWRVSRRLAVSSSRSRNLGGARYAGGMRGTRATRSLSSRRLVSSRRYLALPHGRVRRRPQREPFVISRCDFVSTFSVRVVVLSSSSILIALSSRGERGKREREKLNGSTDALIPWDIIRRENELKTINAEDNGFLSIGRACL